MFGACKSKDQISANVTWYCFNLSLYCVRGVLIHTSIISLWLSCLGPPPFLALLLTKIFELFGFPIFRYWAYLMKVILSVPDEGYSGWAYLMKVIQAERTWWRLFSLSVPDEGYSERSWWRLLSVPDEGYSGWSYLMKVIPETCCVY
jgi:hypothetical protein